MRYLKYIPILLISLINWDLVIPIVFSNFSRGVSESTCTFGRYDQMYPVPYLGCQSSAMSKCLTCHTEIKESIDQQKGYHASVAVKGKECASLS